MKVMLLAAGKGTRLGSRTRKVPKVLIPVLGRTILEHNLRFLKRNGFREIILNLHAGAKQVAGFLKRSRNFGLRIKLSYEEELLGTAGAVKNMHGEWKDDFLVFYGDNLTDFNIPDLIRFHKKTGAVATLGVFHPERAFHTGILAGQVKIKRGGEVEKFIEKRNNRAVSADGYVNAGIAVFSPKILEFIPSGHFCDFARDVYPRLLKEKKKIFAAEGARFLLASDTPETLRETRKMAAKYFRKKGKDRCI